MLLFSAMSRLAKVPSCAAAKRFASSSRSSGSGKYGKFLYLTPIVIGAGAYFAVEPMFHRGSHSGDKSGTYAKDSGVDLKSQKSVDYDRVRKDIAEVMTSNPDYDGIGHYGPILVRLAWHSSGTFDKKSGTGGSNGAGMRFEPEAKFGANNGLKIARDLLFPIKQKYGDGLSFGDLWTLAGVVAIEEMGGPKIEWSPGRIDYKDGLSCPADGRLPDGSKDAKHLRDVFYRMGFTDQEIVALSGGHALGKCHTDRSGFKGPWQFSPSTFSNAYFQLLFSEDWIEKKEDQVDVKEKGKIVTKKMPWSGPKQYTDKKTGELMMLPTDMELIKDSSFKKWAKLYADDEERFFKDFSKAFAKLITLGVPGQCPYKTQKH
ncbi:hypothetical protein MP228_007728 [Amoeboaphelidium protococcarum]|nr:hypothetical protein MP228_007728 [Amoeboaphelidium protococcarum]